MFYGIDNIPSNLLHIQFEYGKDFMEHCQSHTRLLWTCLRNKNKNKNIHISIKETSAFTRPQGYYTMYLKMNPLF